MLNFSWTNVLKNLFAGVCGSSGTKRKGLRGRVPMTTGSEQLESRLLLSATSKKSQVTDNPGGVNIVIGYPDTSVDVEAGQTVLLATIQVSRTKGKLFFSGPRIGGENFDEIFAGAWISEGGRELARMSVNADYVDLTRFGDQIKNRSSKTYQVYGQAESDLPDGVTHGKFGVIHTQLRLLKNKPGFLHLPGAGQQIASVHGHGNPIINPTPAGFTVFPGDQNVEEGTSSSVGVVLDAQPASNVTLNFNLSSGPIGLSTSSVTFTPANWNIPQYVSLSAPENGMDQPDQTQTLTVSVNDALSDNAYDPLADEVFMYGFSDNDPTVNPVQGDFSLSLTPTSISEVAGTTTATVTLNSTFASNVSIQVGTLSSALTGGGTLTFAPGETVKTITFVSVNNNVDEADRQATITATVLAGSDSRFTVGLSKTAVVMVIDDDPTVNPVAGDFSLSVTPASISENGGITTATITLNSVATSSVSIQVSASSGAVSGGGMVTFAPGETTKTVTFIGVNNTVDEADRVVTITATTQAGSDPRFVGLTKTTTVTVVDDEPTVDPNPQGPEISRFITYIGTQGGILKVKNMVFQTNVSNLTHTGAAFDDNGDDNVGSSLSEYKNTTVSAVVNGQVTLTFDLEIGPGAHAFQIRSRHPGIQNATFVPVSMLVETLDGQVKQVTFVKDENGGPYFYQTVIAA